MQRIVAGKLKQDWSPQQIAGWLRDQYPESPEVWVSHETIYRSLFVQARGALKKELIGRLRSSRSIRRPRHAVEGRVGERILDAVPISQRPAEVQDRAVPGRWEGDLVEGARGTFIATLVERRSRFVILVKLPEKRTEVVVAALNSENSIIRSRSALSRFSRGTVGNQLPRQAQGLSVQFSMFNLGTRPNSRVLFVTSVTPRPRAWAAMNRSFAPIIVPRVFKWARIFA